MTLVRVSSTFSIPADNIAAILLRNDPDGPRIRVYLRHVCGDCSYIWTSHKECLPEFLRWAGLPPYKETP